VPQRNAWGPPENRKVDSARWKTIEDRWHARLDRANEAYGLVLVMTILTFVTLSVLPEGGWERFFGIVVAGSTVVVALASSDVRGARLKRNILAVLVSAVAGGFAASADLRWLAFAAAALISFVMLRTIGVILRRVILVDEVSFRTILGALSAYTLLGITFSFIYLALDLAQVEKYFFEGQQQATVSNLLFFSYTTLTTTGYGNLIPAGQFGESLAVIEMLIGQIFLVTLVARLVAMWNPDRSHFPRLAGKEKTES
jgi:hypothetical protein